MCSVIGYSPVHPTEDTVTAFGRLFEQSRIRGLHAFGLADFVDGELRVYRSFQSQVIPQHFDPLRPTIAHARYCQSGDWQVMENNQPLVVGQTAVAMNGVLHMGTKEEFETAFGVVCVADNDSEVFLRRLEQGQTPQAFLEEITGSCAMTWLKDGHLWAGRNARRPLWRADEFGGVWFASTQDIFHRAGFTRICEVPLLEVQEL